MKRLVFLIGLVATVAVLPFPMLSGPRGQASAAVFTQVSAGGYHTCSVRTDSTLACWGDNTYGQATPPAAPVGGIAELPVFAGTSAEETGAPAEGSGWPAGDYAALAGGLAAAALLIAVGGLYTRTCHKP
jgi:hypothetical protein